MASCANDHYASLRAELEELVRFNKTVSFPVSPPSSSFNVNGSKDNDASTLDFDTKPLSHVMPVSPVDEGRVDALEHENNFLREKIRESGELLQQRDADLKELQGKARGRIDALNADNQHFSQRAEQLERQLKSAASAEKQREEMMREIEAVQQSSQVLRDMLKDGDEAHAATQRHLKGALLQLEGAHTQLNLQEKQMSSLQQQLSAAQQGLALEAAGSTAVIKAKEATFYQAQLKRVQQRMAEQEQELAMSAKAYRCVCACGMRLALRMLSSLLTAHSCMHPFPHSTISAALTVRESNDTKKEEVLAAALQTNTRLQASFDKAMAAKKEIAALQQQSSSVAESSSTGRDTSAPGPPAPAAAAAVVVGSAVPAATSIARAVAGAAQAKRPRPTPGLGDALCALCGEEDYGLMSLCQNRCCRAKFHADCYASLGEREQCPDCQYENA